MSICDVRTAHSLEEALGLTAEGWLPLAGGTDLVPRMKHGLLTGARVVIVRGLGELHGVHTTDTGLVVGACTTIADLCRSSACPPWLGEACTQIASPRVRELATVGGSLLQERRCRYYNRPVLWRTASGACLRTGGDRCLAGGDRCLAGGDRCVAGGDRGVAGGDRYVAGGDRCVAGGDRCVAGGDRCLAGGDRYVAGGDRGLAGGDRYVAGGDRGLAGGDRCVATQRSLLSTVLVAIGASVMISQGAEERNVLLEDLYRPEAGAWRAGGIIRSISISRVAEAEGKVALEWIRRRASIDYHDLVVVGALRRGSPHEFSVTVGAAIPYPRRIVLHSPAPEEAVRAAAALIPSAQPGRLSPAYLRHAAAVLARRVIARVAP